MAECAKSAIFPPLSIPPEDFCNLRNDLTPPSAVRPVADSKLLADPDSCQPLRMGPIFQPDKFTFWIWQPGVNLVDRIHNPFQVMQPGVTYQRNRLLGRRVPRTPNRIFSLHDVHVFRSFIKRVQDFLPQPGDLFFPERIRVQFGFDVPEHVPLDFGFNLFRCRRQSLTPTVSNVVCARI